MSQPHVIQEPAEDVSIVAIGSSAGGITALQKLFQTLPQSQASAFVVLQHLPGGVPVTLVALIAQWTSMSVRFAIDGTRPAPSCVYVASPDRILTLEEGAFRTRPAEGGKRRPGIDSIDAFLESLALYEGPRPVAIILSGMGMDGTAGAVRIRQAGGVVIVQDPLTAMYDAMPNAVINRGIHDHVLPVSAIGRQLKACLAPDYVRPERSSTWGDDVSKALGRILSLIRQHAGFELSGYKPSPLLWRIQQRMDLRRVWTFDDYASLVEDDPVELETLARGIPIHVTEFFRDPDAWAVLKEEVLLPLVIASGGQRPLRVWTPACSTGEEAYSVAMLLTEIAQETGIPTEFQLFATDAAPEVLARARRGFFSEHALAAVSNARKKRFFYTIDGGFRVKGLVRENMVFAAQDLISDPPFSALDLVTCRNLFIYLEPDTIRHVLYLLHSALRMGGYLLLGKSETLVAGQEGFETVSRSYSLYRKVGPMPHVESRFSNAAYAPAYATASEAVQRAALQQVSVPSLLVDDQCCVLRVFGNTENILSLPAGEPTHNFIELVPRPWAAVLRDSTQRAFSSRESVTLTNLPARVTGDAAMTVRLTPLQASNADLWDRMLVSFIPGGQARDEFDAVNECPWQADDGGIVGLDRETRAHVSREELAASREELQALNEELKTSNAELNAINEELNGANAQLQEKIAQLQMQSRVLSSGAVMTLFLDEELKLRWFTPAMRQVLPLTPRDTGRSVADLAPTFHDRDFFEDIRAVLETRHPREALVRNSDDKWFLRRTYPCLSAAGAIAGVAITFADVTERTRTEDALRASESTLRRSQGWLCAEKEAFRAAMNCASLETSLGILIRTLISQAQDERRCAFYLAEGNSLRHIVGMSDDYAQCVDGFPISPESLACGLAVATGEPVITRDVLDEPRWQQWTWLAEKFGYRGCWSFPVETSDGNLVGSLAMYFAEPREPSGVDLELAAAFTQTAAIIIWRHLQAGGPDT